MSRMASTRRREEESASVSAASCWRRSFDFGRADVVVDLAEIHEPIDFVLKLSGHGRLRLDDQRLHLFGGECFRFGQHRRKQLLFHRAAIEQIGKRRPSQRSPLRVRRLSMTSFAE